MAKKGDLNVCPNCGAALMSGSAKCTECGYTLSNISANTSAILLDKRLQSCSSKERPNVIRSFPIPNTREDLMEFLSALEPKALVHPHGSEYEKKETRAYYEKYVECLNKARISFGTDSATKMFETNLANFKRKQNLIISSIVALALIIIGCLIWAIVSNVQEGRSRDREEIAQKAELKEEYDLWLQTVTPQIEAYSDSLMKELDKIPAPTVTNWEKCGQMWNKATWSKRWAMPTKFKHLVAGRENPNYVYKKEFVEKKNSIGETIRMAHQQVLMNQGKKSHEAHNATVSEFYESVSWLDY